MSELPDTGGPLPLIALLGGLAAALAGGLGWYRRRR
jgi:LPXTG-motif cell wall-anchored protein